MCLTARATAAVMILLAAAAPAAAAVSYRVNRGASQMIAEHGACRFVKNGSTDDVFVPTRTAEEWSAFYTRPPGGVTITACCAVNGGAKVISEGDGTRYQRVPQSHGYTDHWAYCQDGVVYVRSHYYQYSTGFSRTEGFFASVAHASGRCRCSNGWQTFMDARTTYKGSRVLLEYRIGGHCCSSPQTPPWGQTEMVWP